MKRLSYRAQRTIGRPACISGVGFITGADVALRFRPAQPETGIVFVRTDLRPQPRICADAGEVSGTARRTTLGQAPKAVTLVEHVMAALAGLRIDNCIVELDACEPPGLDGSATGFVEALLEAGIELQQATKSVWAVEKTQFVRSGNSTLAIHPPQNDDLTISYLLDFGAGSPIDRQAHTQRITPGEFASEIACCRTFLLDDEAKSFRQAGIGSRTTAHDLLLFGARGVIDNELRFANEPARHKILDLVGDLALTGMDIRGHVVAYRSGHPLNVELAQTLVDSQGSAVLRPGPTYFRKAA